MLRGIELEWSSSSEEDEESINEDFMQATSPPATGGAAHPTDRAATSSPVSVSSCSTGSTGSDDQHDETQPDVHGRGTGPHTHKRRRTMGPRQPSGCAASSSHASGGGSAQGQDEALLRHDYEAFMETFGEMMVTTKIAALRVKSKGRALLTRTLSYSSHHGRRVSGASARNRFRWDVFTEQRKAAISVGPGGPAPGSGVSDSTEEPRSDPPGLGDHDHAAAAAATTTPGNQDIAGPAEEAEGEGARHDIRFQYAAGDRAQLKYILHYGAGDCLAQYQAVKGMRCLWCGRDCKRLGQLMHHLNFLHPRCWHSHQFLESNTACDIHVRVDAAWKETERQDELVSSKHWVAFETADAKYGACKAQLQQELDRAAAAAPAPPAGLGQQASAVLGRGQLAYTGPRGHPGLVRLRATLHELKLAAGKHQNRYRRLKDFFMLSQGSQVDLEAFRYEGPAARKRARNPERLFYGSHTFLPHPPSHQVDSDDEAEEAWLKECSAKLLGEFSDVNHAEKLLMQLWNDFVGRFKEKVTVLTDAMIPECAAQFVQENHSTIRALRLEKNLRLHFANLFDFNLLSTAQLSKTIRQFAERLGDGDAAPTLA